MFEGEENELSVFSTPCVKEISLALKLERAFFTIKSSQLRLYSMNSQRTAEIGSLVHKSARLVNLFLCYIYGAKVKTWKNIT